MAFNFNWSPLTADAEFYKRAQELLTDALNKSPKPPIIVDDIFVTEFNLGSVPPELEILEIGDLAEDRFRGIFKMCYSGDAFLTLKTRVQVGTQANPLNTYLSAKPTFTSPQPLAAAASLTIPLSITLSEIKLSAFIILVFSKQKGLTLVFRNDPLESLKVSSTFDSIQFVRDYLQRTIEGQLRSLMMDELPAIIHKLSLRLWCPDQLPREEVIQREGTEDEPVVDPFANLPPEAVDSNGHVLDTNEIASISMHGGSELQSLFSQKNLLSLAALTDSQRTLSLFTPGIRDVLFRAWAGSADRSDTGYSTPALTPSLTRTHSLQGTSTTYTFTDTSSVDQGSLPSRPTLSTMHSATTGLALGAGRHSRSSRKKKTRVVNLRRSKAESEVISEAGESLSDTISYEGPYSEPIIPTSIPEDSELPEEEPIEDEQAPYSSNAHFKPEKELPARRPLDMSMFQDPATVENTPIESIEKGPETPLPQQKKTWEASPLPTRRPVNLHDRHRPMGSDTSSVILEQAWIMKMAGEIARRVYDEKQRNENFWGERDDTPPPAYQASQ
ncbi:hypothetical protein M426DRAFT_54454 [Hypoxylon sp. CI-4A]|nr:hypothetical protein M426DRAFT_54454 [Hypoxylon sp. CI-4A]